MSTTPIEDVPTSEDLRALFEKQRSNRWRIAKTTAEERIVKLKKIKQAIFDRQDELHQAIHQDFGKNPAETDLTEIHLTVSEIKHTVKHLKKWMKPHRVKTPLTLFGTRSEVICEPKGLVLILSPWNYPFQLSMAPLVAAVSAGNCVILKPSSKTPHTAHFLKKFIGDLFPEDEIAVVEGDPTVADALLDLPFDHIFFTGSPYVGRKVMEKASKHLASVTLELGGKSPVIVDDSVDVKKAAERIAWGKFINAGQTCVAPDYILIDEKIAEPFAREMKNVVARRYGKTESEQEKNPDFCRIVSEGHLQNLKRILDDAVRQGGKIEFGGKSDSKTRYLSPTLLTGVRDDSPIMKEEIFGPILPLVPYRTLDEALEIVRKREKPLALYIFSKNQKNIDDILKNTTSGGTCVNSLVIHLANPDLPFGGIGMSGMGNYHGFYGFKTFSHERAILKQGAVDMIRFFYPPYTPRVRKLIQFVMKHLG